LHIDQAGELSGEVGLLMYGITPPQQFISKVQNALNINNDLATKISTDVNERIFRPIRESLKKIHQMAPSPKIAPMSAPDPKSAITITAKSAEETPHTKSSDIQGPPALASEVVVKKPALETMPKMVVDPYREPVDDRHVIAPVTSVGIPNVPVKNSSQPINISAIPPKPATPDLYREPISVPLVAPLSSAPTLEVPENKPAPIVITPPSPTPSADPYREQL